MKPLYRPGARVVRYRWLESRGPRKLAGFSSAQSSQLGTLNLCAAFRLFGVETRVRRRVAKDAAVEQFSCLALLIVGTDAVEKPSVVENGRGRPPASRARRTLGGWHANVSSSRSNASDSSSGMPGMPNEWRPRNRDDRPVTGWTLTNGRSGHSALIRRPYEPSWGSSPTSEWR